MTDLVRYEAARAALAEACRVDEVKSLRNKAAAMQEYARQAKDGELVGWGTEIRARAEIRAGEMLAEMAERRERASSQDSLLRGSAMEPRDKPTLQDLDITKAQSHR